jgi:protein required for attachment to host cells
MRQKRTWILVADGARARVLRSAGRDRHLEAVEGLELAADHARTHELMTDRLGRVVEAHGKARHAVEPKSDPHRELKRSFAAKLAAILDERLQQGAYHRLVLVAPPKMLGDLRAALSPAVRHAVAAELAKDLTQVTMRDIPDHLHGHIVL